MRLSVEQADRADGHLEVSLRLGIWSSLEAYRIHPTVPARAALLSAVQASVHASSLIDTETVAVATSQDGSLLVTGDAHGNLRVWDVDPAGRLTESSTLEESPSTPMAR